VFLPHPGSSHRTWPAGHQPRVRQPATAPARHEREGWPPPACRSAQGTGRPWRKHHRGTQGRRRSMAAGLPVALQPAHQCADADGGQRPAGWHELLKTAADPSRAGILGTLNNCSSGVTPWGTYLTCEENWHHYFLNRDTEDLAARTAHARYGVSGGKRSKLYGWESADERFDATPDPGLPHGGYVNE